MFIIFEENDIVNKVNAYAALKAKEPLRPFQIERRAPRDHDVEIDIHYCGICHSDVHQARNEWQGAMFPMVPGHEIVGVVRQVGSAVSKFAVGDKVGVGCLVDSCRTCESCHHGLEQYCNQGIYTYNSQEADGTVTYGGYSTQIVVDENYVLRIPEHLPLAAVAPLLCAGITTYSPMRHWNIQPKMRVAVVGLGGLGHMAVKIAAAMGAEVSVLSTSERKQEDALRFGAKYFLNTRDSHIFTTHADSFDFILNTAPGSINLNSYLNLLKRDKTMVLIGLPEHESQFSPEALIFKRKQLAGSLIGGIQETQEMLDFCGQHAIVSDIELISATAINQAFDRIVKSDVRYRFVIDIQSLKS